jgi:hypothetical protein
MSDYDDLVARNIRQWAHLLASGGPVITRTWHNTETGEAVTDLIEPADVFSATPPPPASPDPCSPCKP